MSESLTILNTTKGKLPRLPFAAMKDQALGKNYELELVFVEPHEMQAINMKHRGKDLPTNILSFPLSENSGQIFICPSVAKKKQPISTEHFQNTSDFCLSTALFI
jgi:ssRNA-specific RNase YbeY (16S rRNA maturation enzyme)